MVYDKEVPIELRLVEDDKDAEEAGTMESIKTKILILVGPVDPGRSRESSVCEDRTDFRSGLVLPPHFYVFQINNSVTLDSYEEVKEKQQLNVAFDGYIGLLIRMFNNVNKEPHVYGGCYSGTSPYSSCIKKGREEWTSYKTSSISI